TDDRGEYRVYGVPEGQFVVLATGENDAIRTYYPGTTNPSAAIPVSISASEDLRGVDFALAPAAAARVSGHITDSQGKAFVGSVVLKTSRRAGSQITTELHGTVSPNGQFVVKNVPRGEW